jgi:hypothetical protein
MTTSKDNIFVAYWDCNGFECIVDVTSYERKKLLAEIKGESIKMPVSLTHLTMRARFNPQRSPEIWLFTSEVNEATLQKVAEEDPQMLVDLIRSHGKCLWKNKHQEGVIK